MLKDLLTSAPVLTLPPGDEGYIGYYDASRVGLRCVLRQYEKVIAYASCKLKKHNRTILHMNWKQKLWSLP